MKAKFKLKEPEYKGKTLIYLKAYFNGKRMVYSTGLKVDTDNWLFDKERCKENQKFREGKFINENLSKILKAFTKCYYDSDKTVEDVKRLMDIELGHTTKKHNITFIEYFKQHKDEFIKSNGHISGKKYDETYSKLNEFFKYQRRIYDWNDINGAFGEEFTNYLYEVDKGIKSTNTVSSLLSKIKTVMKAGFEKKLHINPKYTQIKIKEVDVFNISLNENELLSLLGKDVRLTKLEKNVRDLFLIAAYTGLRYSDFTKLKPEHFKGDRIKITTEKTTTEVVIPIHRVVKEIWNKGIGLFQDHMQTKQ